MFTVSTHLMIILMVGVGGAAAMQRTNFQEVEMNTQVYDAPESDVADMDVNVKMQVDLRGEGQPLVLVGGGLTGWKSWEPHAERLASIRSVARLQPLNVQYGLDNRPLPTDYSVSLEVAAMTSTLDGLGWGHRVDIVGWSYGALISLEFALRNPHRIRTLTLIEPPAVWVLDDRGGEDDEVRALMAFSEFDDVSESDLQQFLDNVGLIPPGSSPADLPQWPVWKAHRRSLRGVGATFDHDGDPDRLNDFEQPVLLVTGAGTASYLRRIHDELASRLPRSRDVEMEGGHAPHIVSMDRFMQELAEFHEPRADHESDLPPGRLNMSIIDSVTSRDGTRIGFVRRGQGRPILFVHGTTADHRSWDLISPHLEADFSVIAMDRRGRGASGDSPEYALEREAEDIAAVVESFEEPVILFGHSYGGLCSLEAALRTGQISALVLYEPALPDGTPTIAPGVRDRIEDLVNRGELERAMELTLREVALIPDHELETYRNSKMWTARIPLARTIPREMAVETMYAFSAPRFADLQVPTVLLLGEESGEPYRSWVESLDAALPNSTITTLPGERHIAHHTNPSLLALTLRQLLE